MPRQSLAHTRLDVVAVRVEDESGVVAHHLRRARPRRTIVDAAGIQRRGVEPIDRRAVLRGEGDVDRRRRRTMRRRPERRQRRADPDERQRLLGAPTD